MRPNARSFKSNGGAAPQDRRGAPVRKPNRRGAPASAAHTHTIELTRVQQLEAKAARDAVLAAAPRASPAAAKRFVEAISLDVDVEAARQLALASKALATLPNSIGVLCQQLRKLDLSHNDLTDLSPLASLQHLSNLNVAHNARLASLKGLSGTCLSVLNVSFCAVESLVGLEHTALTLRTLIANDNRLRLQSSLFADERGQLELPEDERAALAAAKQHLPASLLGSVKADPVAVRNYTLLSTFQQCETVVLSRNPPLVYGFPAWTAEELAEQCGDTAAHAANDAGDSERESEGEDGEESGSDAPTRGGGARAKTKAGAAKKTPRTSAGDDAADDARGNKDLKHAMALAHPLSVFDRLPRLKKLSLSGCELHSLPSRWFLPMVTELRLAQNHLTSLQPDGVILRSLHILDVSNNLFVSVMTLRRCRFLEQLTVRGNPLIDEGMLRDKAAGLTHTEAAAEVGKDAAAAALAVPISVQQRAVRLFPNMKMMDNQPVLTSNELRAAYKRGRDTAAAAAAAQQQAGTDEMQDDDSTHSDGELGVEDGDEETTAPRASAKNASQSLLSPATTSRYVASSSSDSAAARKVRRVDPAVIAAEAEEKDVVVEPPSSVVKTAHAPIVRRERVLLRPVAAAAAVATGKGGHGKKEGGGVPAVLGQAAVNKLLEQSRKTSAW